MVVWLVAGLVEMVADINDIWVSFAAQKQVQLAILVPSILIDAFDSDCFIVKQVGSTVD